MTFQFHSEDRKVVPRWRQLFRTNAHELRSAISTPVQIDGAQDEVSKKAMAWQETNALEHAADLLFAGCSVGLSTETIGAARQIAKDPKSTDTLKRLAEGSLGNEEPIISELRSAEEQHQNAQKAITYLRKRSNEYPRNAFLRIELARQYLMLGQLMPATRAATLAMILAPENRYVLRSIARLLVHADDIDHAHWILRHADCVTHDPWVLAAEIAVGSLAGRQSRFVKTARSMILSDKFAPGQLTELASSLGTLELEHGANKKARRLFGRSLKAPNDNSLAQAIWASRSTHSIDLKVSEKFLCVPNSHEAAALTARNNLDWSGIVSNCDRWTKDEPFSSRPAMFGSYAAAVLVGDFQKAIDFAEAGLRSNRQDPWLKNNKVVGLVNLGRLEEAIEVSSTIAQPDSSDERYSTYLATRGLLAFRQGNLLEGRAHYLDAIEHADRLGRKNSGALAVLHLAKEECLVGTPEAHDYLESARDHIDKTKNEELKQALKVIQETISPKVDDHCEVG